jgi:hypothetical protein
MMTLHALLIVSLLVARSCSFPVHGQGVSATGTTNCNNVGRVVAVPSGVSGSIVTENCSQITVTVAGASYSTPSSCTVAYTHYLETVWACQGTTPGLDCDPEGSIATHVNYIGGACPNVAGLASGMSWGAWSEVPQNLVAIIQGMSSCIPPTPMDEFDYSAKTTRCRSGTQPLRSQEPPRDTRSTPDGTVVVPWNGDPRTAVPGSEAFNPFKTDYDLASASGGGALQPDLRRVSAAFPGIPGVALRARVQVKDFEPGAEHPRSTVDLEIEGRLAADGTFDVVRTSVARNGADERILHRREVFDGVLLIRATQGAEEANAYTLDYARRIELWRMQVLPTLRPLHRWLVNPFEIPGFATHTYRREAAEGLVFVRKIAQGSRASYVDQVFTVDAASAPVPHVLSTAILDEQGDAIESSTFSNPRAFGPGFWRPAEVQHTLFLDAQPLGRRVELRYWIDEAHPLTAEEAAAIHTAPYPENVDWSVWF